MRDCRCCQEVNASPPTTTTTTTRKSGVKLKLFSLFFWFSGRAGGTKRESGQVGVETAATRRHMFVYTSLMKSGHAGGGGDDKWL